MKKIWNYILYAIVWLAIVAYVVYASVAVHTHRSKQVVESVDIIIVDSTSNNKLVTTPMVERWIAQSKVRTTGQSVDSVKLNTLESHIKSSGFVDEAKAYISYDGVLRIEISQLHPTLRVLIDGYNSYITRDGYIFARPSESARYVPVVTGDYSLLFRPGYSGEFETTFEAQMQELESQIERVERKQIYPLYAKQIATREKLREVNRRYTSRRFGESRKSVEKRIAELRERNAKERAIYTAALRQIEHDIEREQKKQELYRGKQKKLQKRYEDFIKLLTFVDIIENDKFWRAEIVQLVASEASNGELLLELIPRSGDHTITFGPLEDIELKLSNLESFYRKVMPTRKWAGVANINVEYKNQVVCKDRK